MYWEISILNVKYTKKAVNTKTFKFSSEMLTEFCNSSFLKFTGTIYKDTLLKKDTLNIFQAIYIYIYIYINKYIYIYVCICVCIYIDYILYNTIYIYIYISYHIIYMTLQKYFIRYEFSVQIRTLHVFKYWKTTLKNPLHHILGPLFAQQYQ